MAIAKRKPNTQVNNSKQPWKKSVVFSKEAVRPMIVWIAVSYLVSTTGLPAAEELTVAMEYSCALPSVAAGICRWDLPLGTPLPGHRLFYYRLSATGANLYTPKSPGIRRPSRATTPTAR